MTQPFSGSAAERNKGPIFERMVPLLEPDARVLEIGAGQGGHARYAADCLPGISWQTSERPERLHQLQQGLDSCTALPAPIALDVAATWPSGPFTVVYAANVTHIMAWPEVEQLFAGSAGVLAPSGLLCLYGPFIDDDSATAASNTAFDTRLRDMDPAMGLRRIQALDELAHEQGMVRRHDWSLPANNRLLAWAVP